MNSSPTPSATSSPASASGRSPFAVQDGQMIDLFGRVPVRANLSPRQARELGLMTSGTYGQTSIGSFRSAGLQSSLESKLRKRLTGSALCEVIWLPWTTQWAACLSRPRARVRSHLATGFSLWRTPMASDGKKADCLLPGVFKRMQQGRQISLAMQARLALSSASMESSGRLSPEHSRWLMNIPAEWSNCAPTETASTLKRRRSS